MQTTTNTKVYVDRKVWFSMWFLGAVVTFGVAFFPMFYRLVDGRNGHFQKEVDMEEQFAVYLDGKIEKVPAMRRQFKAMNAKAWAASIILIVPIFVLLYLLSRDLAAHEQEQDAFLMAALPERMFMPQTIPIKTYALLTVITLGVGAVYWLYKLVNLYNAHYKAHLLFEKELAKLVEEQKSVKHL